MKNTPILSYKEVLENIESKENNLLIANGFNYGLGVNTGYDAIFRRMAENNKEIYNDALEMVNECNFDLEYFIGKLESDIAYNNTFLKKYVRNKIKLDFMQATHEIVKSEIKNIYAEKNEGVFLLLKNFTNYFTLNYDSFLYLLLLKYKPKSNSEYNSFAFQPTLKFIEEDLNESQNNIYNEIKTARQNGRLGINFGDSKNPLEKDFNLLTKSHFIKEVREYSKTSNKGWKAKDIDRVVKSIFEEEKTNVLLNTIDDGSKQLKLFEDNIEFIYDVNSDTQNLFFLHGAFHIYKDKDNYKKITQQTDKALYDKLEEILNSEEKEIVCVFQHENKKDVINGNGYLQNCLRKLEEISGNLVVIGSSLADNDNHIFQQINNSQIETIYISTLFKNRDKVMEIAKTKFPTKNIYLFDAETISYEMPVMKKSEKPE